MHTTDICKQQIKVKTATPTTTNYKIKYTWDRIRYMPWVHHHDYKLQTPVKFKILYCCWDCTRHLPFPSSRHSPFLADLDKAVGYVVVVVIR